MQRKIVLSKAFSKAAAKYLVFKYSIEEEQHSLKKLQEIYSSAAKIASETTYPGKRVTFGNSKNLQYFIYQQHIVLFHLRVDVLELKYFVVTKRVKKTLS